MSTDFEHQKISKSQRPLKQLNNNNNNGNNNNNFIYIELISRAHGALQCEKKKKKNRMLSQAMSERERNEIIYLSEA